MDFAVTRMSSKGQIVIPKEMRENFNIGEKIFLIEDNGQIILKNKDSVKASVLDDLEFARRTEEAYKEIEAGKGIRVKLEDLDKVMDSWRE
jgi:AbrB family looped-hinge helix DNA binding protein